MLLSAMVDHLSVQSLAIGERAIRLLTLFNAFILMLACKKYGFLKNQFIEEVFHQNLKQLAVVLKDIRAYFAQIALMVGQEVARTNVLNAQILN